MLTNQQTKQLGVCLKPFTVNCGNGQNVYANKFRMIEMYERKTPVERRTLGFMGLTKSFCMHVSS